MEKKMKITMGSRGFRGLGFRVGMEKNVEATINGLYRDYYRRIHSFIPS